MDRALLTGLLVGTLVGALGLLLVLVNK